MHSYNTFLKLAEARQSCRAYDPNRAVEPGILRRIVEAARLAPSACNSQPWHLVVVTDADKRKEVASALKSMGMNGFVDNATAFIVIVQESPNFTARLGGWIRNKHFPLIDCGIVASHVILAATDMGVGSCVLGWFDESALRKSLGVPRGKRILLAVALGYATDEPRLHSRKSPEEMSSENIYKRVKNT